MHNIDINFLKERKQDAVTQVGKTAGFKKETTMADRIPILIGSGVAVALIAAVGGASLLLNNQKASTEASIAQLESEIQRLQGQNAQVNQIQQQIDNINGQVGILVSVFDEIKPWSAMLREISFLTPPNVQIQSITQSGSRGLTIAGFADSYDDVNDFLLTLKASSLLNGEQTQLTNTSLTENPSTVATSRAQLEAAEDETVEAPPTDDSLIISLGQVISFNITTEINDVPSTELVNLLDSRGAIGLVSRIEALRQLGALDIEPIVQEQPTEEETTQ
ncbi:PilN domain-containing protein [Cyanobacterium stanieri LEGE 03274]|uniref:PilN domain-containing protein n=1 Tax=Cyanobacterium stanieri LEGE 03274 TaxID=1828756 RepID=A0ABR9V5D7_9CHRO|nr:PilN domain-containing protein [Cyanobacterium stanieri]MBE9223109.1 PilN domain-containing protein [Cyanobacterium stanieri LEGE 03274]